jgi:hypothetical protein
VTMSQTVVRLWFTESVQPAATAVRVTGPAVHAVAFGTVMVAQEPKSPAVIAIKDALKDALGRGGAGRDHCARAGGHSPSTSSRAMSTDHCGRWPLVIDVLHVTVVAECIPRFRAVAECARRRVPSGARDAYTVA